MQPRLFLRHNWFDTYNRLKQLLAARLRRH
jgi:hypothetical protein